MTIEKKQIIELDVIDSTNNYAMKIIDSDKAFHGLTISAKIQTNGKGQRGKLWNAEYDKSILISTIVIPNTEICNQFIFNTVVCLAIYNVLIKQNNNFDIKIKWPNDIIINDKKAGGVLIENVIRGNKWMYAIIGLGLNVNQSSFNDELPFATSLRKEAGVEFDKSILIYEIVTSIIHCLQFYAGKELEALKTYNEILYKRGKIQTFKKADNYFDAKILIVKPDGTIEIERLDNVLENYRHGEIIWQYGTTNE